MSSQVIALDLLERRSAALSAAERALRITLSGSPTPIVLLDLDLKPVLFSQGWLDQAVTPRTSQSPNAEPLAPNAEFTAAAGRCLETGAVETCRVEIPADAEGCTRWFSFEFSPWPRGSAYSRFVVVGREVTEAVLAAREAEIAGQRLAEQNARFDAALSNMPHGLCMFDAEKRLILCNTAYRRLYDVPDALSVPGTRLDDILEHRCSIGKGPRSFAAFYAATVEAAVRGAAATRDVELTDGRTIRITHNPTADGGYVATHEDVTESISAAAQIEFLAFRDPLTGLPNRAAFQRA
jgi:PAS domain-containing protein